MFMLLSLMILAITSMYGGIADAGSYISVGSAHTCFVNPSKSMYCWGSNSNGQISEKQSLITLGSNIEDLLTLKPLAQSVNEVSCGRDHTCFAKSDGVYCFGGNIYGQLGLDSPSASVSYKGSTSKVSLPSSSIYHVSTFDSTTCASTSDSVYCWGRSVAFMYGAKPVMVTNGLGSTPNQLTVGRDHGCYLLPNGDAYCWGLNTYGQLGISSTDTSVITLPTKVDVSLPLSAISAGDEYTCVVYSGSNAMACFGRNYSYRLGDGTENNKGNLPSEMSTLLTNTLLGSGMAYAGSDATCLVRSGNSGIYCIGGNTNYLVCTAPANDIIGDDIYDYPPNNTIPVPLTGSITLGVGTGTHVCASNTTDVYCWGINFFGQLGNGNSDDLKSCTSEKSFQKVCIDNRCPSSKCSKCETNIIYLIPVFVVVGTLILTYSILTMIGLRKRKEFDAKTYLLPSGAQITGAEIYLSHSRPIEGNRLGQPAMDPQIKTSDSIPAAAKPAMPILSQSV